MTARQNVLMWTLTSIALAVSSPANAQIRPYEFLSDEWLAGKDTDDAIAASERHGETDTKERADLIVAVHEWYQCAQGYDEVTRRGNKGAITWDKTNIAVLSCVEQRSKVRQLAKVYSAVNGTPSMADQKSGRLKYLSVSCLQGACLSTIGGKQTDNMAMLQITNLHVTAADWLT